MKETKHGYYESLYELAAAMNSAPNSDAVLDAIVQNTTKSLGAKGCSLMLLTPDRKLLIHSRAYGLSDQYIKKGPVSADKSISEALEGKPVAVLDATTDERMEYREQAKQEGVASVLAVPMSLRDKIVGVLRVYTGEKYQFTEEDIYFVSAIANLGAIALENAKRYEHLEEGYEAFRRSTF